MDYVKVGGVCLLLLVIAAALPTNVLAQTPQVETSSGATPIISKSLLSESSGKGETISTDNLAKRNTGLKPLAKPGSTAASEAFKTTEQVESPTTSVPDGNCRVQPRGYCNCRRFPGNTSRRSLPRQAKRCLASANERPLQPRN